MASHIPVICDRCRAYGYSDDDPFVAFGALLDFDPVPRRTNRAVGKSAFGVTQLIKHEGSEGFRAAREEALALVADERSRRLAEGLRMVAAEQSGWRPPDPP